MSSNQNSSNRNQTATAKARRMFVTLSVGAFLSGMFIFYNVLITPLAKPPVFKRKAVSKNINKEDYYQPAIYKEIGQKHLSQYPWTKEAEYLAKTDSSYIFSKTMETEGTDLVFEPFAMVLFRPDKDGVEQVYTVECPQAYITFQKDLSIKTKGSVGRIIKGRLVGKVQIIGPDNLQIDGRNFIYDEVAKKIYSDNEIAFQYKSHHGTANKMDIELFNDKNESSIEQLAFNNVSKFILRSNVNITMIEENAEKVKKNAPLEVLSVRSKGSFTFDVKKMIASFDKNVRVIHPDLKQPNLFDKLLCDHLVMTLDESLKPGQKKPEKKVKKSGSSLENEISIKKMVATGKKVELESEANNFEGMMNKLVYDRVIRLVTMSSTKQVEINRQGNVIHSPVIKIKHTEENEITHTWCQGTGDMKYLNEEDGKIAFSANWKKELSIKPDEDLSSGLELITFKEKVQIKQPLNNSGLAAETVYVFVKRNDKKDKKNKKKKTNSSKDSASENFEIKKMLALDKVVMIDPKMTAKTDRLEVFFEEEINQNPAALSSPKKTPIKKTAQVDSNIQQIQFEKKSVTQQNNNFLIPPRKNNLITVNPIGSQKQKIKKKVVKKPEDKPAVIEAKKIRVRILVTKEKKEKTNRSDSPMNNDSNKLSEVLATGNVQVKQDHINGDKPMNIHCDALHIKNDKEIENHQILHIYGVTERVENRYLDNKTKSEHPAQISDRGLLISGRVIHMDRANNYAEVEGAGLLELPVTQTMDGEKLDKPQVLAIWWDEKMTFDGKNANFYGNVRTVMDTNRITCEEMKVVLKEKISFAEVNKPKNLQTKSKKKEKTDIETLDCFGNVSFHSKSYEEDLLTEVRDGSFAELHMNRPTGKTFAQGPGILKSWRRGSSVQLGQNKNKPKKKTKKEKSDEDKKWQYSRIKFADKTKGNMNYNEMTFTGRVNVLNGPVDRVLEELDEDYLPEKAALMRCESLQLVHHPAKSEEEKAFIEMIASKRAILESGKYQIWADQITYNESQDLFIARSLGKQKASVWQASETGGEGSTFEAQTIKLIPSIKSLKLDKATSIDGSL